MKLRPTARTNIALLLGAVFFLSASLAHAEAPKHMEVSPGVIDEKAKARDIIKESITIKNTWDRPLNLFPSVEDVNPENGDQNFSYAGTADTRSDTLANWIELSRGVIALAPGETKTVPFVIHVNMNAVPNQYHVQINFTDGSTRDETSSKAADGSVSVNLEVLSDVKEELQLVKFTTDRVVFSGDDVLFNYLLENIGNQDLQPSGSIRVYDRRGKEVASVDVNREGKSVTPEQTAQLATAWSAVEGFGQYKAVINVTYGRSQIASVQDTIFFWIIPWKQILGLLIATIIAVVVLALYFRQWFEEQHLQKLALAGLLTTHPAAVPAFIPPFPVPKTPPQRPVPQPPKPKAPEEPKERFILKIAENIVIGWRLFTTFKQRGRITPQDIVKEKESVLAKPAAPVAEPSPAASPAQVSHDAPGVEAQWHSWRPQEFHGETIDLKKMREKPKETVHEGHIVNLKKPL